MNYTFLVGCPRSGTTWLQMLLAQHPAIATTQETHLFNGYVEPLQDAWRRHESTRRRIGLQAAMPQEQFDELCSDFARRALSRIDKNGAGSCVVLEKTPEHALHVPLIVKLLPEARFVHLIRDPRAVVASLCAAGHSWGQTWASTDPVANARLWVAYVSAGRDIASLTEHHYTVKYEDLLNDDGWRVLQSLLTWLNLDADENFCRQAMANCALDRLRNNSQSLPAGAAISGDPADFYRKGKADAWSDDLSPRNVRIIEFLAGGLMQAYGYTRSVRPPGEARKPLRLKLLDGLDGIEWRARRALARSFAKARRLL